MKIKLTKKQKKMLTRIISAVVLLIAAELVSHFVDLPRAALATLLIAFCVFLINLLLRWSGLHPKANYFFSVETEGNFLLEIFYSWLPFPFLYLLPSIVILGVYMTLVTLPFALADRSGSRKK